MNGAQDLGGMQSFGPVQEDAHEEFFQHPWERRVFAMTLAMGASGAWNLDESRSARESLAPHFYLSAGYYGIWFAGLCSLMLERGLISKEELNQGRSLSPALSLPRVARAELVPAALAKGSSVARAANQQAKFKIGQTVRVRRNTPATHTRVPRYIRGCRGEIVRQHGCHVFPDSHACGGGEDPRWLYNVRFDARELWGDQAQLSTVHVDCWEPYLEQL